MTIKEVLVNWLKLSVILAMLIISHLVLHFEGARPLAEFFAPPYVALSEKEALDRYPAYVGSVVSDRERFSILRCYRAGLPQEVRDCMNREVSEARTTNPPLSGVHEEHARRYRMEEVDPVIEKLRSYVFPWIFGVLYALIALMAAAALKRWFISHGLPALCVKMVKLGWIAQNFAAWRQGRSLRNAAREFADLTNLHQNGVISDELFLKRKAELSAALESGRRVV